MRRVIFIMAIFLVSVSQIYGAWSEQIVAKCKSEECNCIEGDCGNGQCECTDKVCNKGQCDCGDKSCGKIKC